MFGKKNFITITLIIFVAAITRLLPHPPNFTPIAGMALLGSAYFDKKYLAFLVPMLALFVSNLVLNNVLYAQYYDGFVWFSPQTLWVFGSIALISLLGINLLKKVNTKNVIIGAVSASLLFFAITNFGSWLSDPMYTKDLSGLVASYINGLPFLRNTLFGDLFYSGVLFGIYHFATQPNRSLSTQR